MQLFISVLCVFACIHLLDEYGMTDTVLGNVGWNDKLMQHDFIKIKNTIEGIKKRKRYYNSKKIHNVLKQYAKKIYPIDIYPIEHVKYGLVKNNFLTDTGNKYNMKVYHEIPNDKLEYYINELSDNIEGMDVSSEDVSIAIDKVLKNDIYTENNARKDFIKEAQNYFVKKGTIQFKKPSIFNRFISKLKATEHIKPIGVVTGTVLGLGGVAYEIGKANAMKNITKDMNDHVHMTLFGILVIVCSVAATLALCVTVAYHITNKKQQSDITYSNRLDLAN